MTNRSIHRWAGKFVMPCLAAAAMGGLAADAQGQISLATAVDLAIRNSPRVKSSAAEVQRARAALQESKDVYIPTLSAGSAIGEAYGFSNYPPTFFTLTSGSLIYNAAQNSYVAAAGAGLEAAQRTLEDTREAVAEDAALTFNNLDHDQEREAVLKQEFDYASALQQIVEERFNAGLDTRMNLLDAQLSVANLKLARLRMHNDGLNDQLHLAQLMGVPKNSLRAEGGFPDRPITAAETSSTGGYANGSVAAAFASARSKQAQARGDSKFLYRPQISFAAQYNRYATYTNAWKLIEQQYGQKDANGNFTLGANEEVIGVQITIPLLDRARRQRALESAAEAGKSLHDAEFAQFNVLDAQGRLDNSIQLLKAQADVAGIEQQRAQEQLDIVRAQLTAPVAGMPPLTPKDEQNARVSEREKYLAVIDDAYQLHQSEISLLRQTGHLEDWLVRAGLTSPGIVPSVTQPHR